MAEEFRQESTEVEGVTLHWAELGATSAHPPVVLLHGLGDSHLTWRAIAPGLAADRRVLMLDLPGCGYSGRPDTSYTLAWQAHVVAEWLAQLELDPVDIVGHSYGGGIAQMLLLECRPRIRRLALAASGGLGRELNFWLRFAAFPYFVERFGQPFMAFGTRRSPRGPERPGDIEELVRMNAMPGTARAFSRTVRDVISFRGQERRADERAHEIASFPPMAVLWGEVDTHIPIAHGRATAERLAGVRFRAFPGCAHFVHHDDPKGFLGELRGFLDDPDPEPVRPT